MKKIKYYPFYRPNPVDGYILEEIPGRFKELSSVFIITDIDGNIREVSNLFSEDYYETYTSFEGNSK